MTNEDMVQAQKSHLGEGTRLVFDKESSLMSRSSRASSRSSSSSSSSSDSDSSYSSGDRSRSPSVSRRSRRRHRHGSRYSSSSSSSSSHSRSRSRPRCCRASDHSRCRRHRHRSRSCSPYPRRSSRYGRRRYSRSSSRSSSRERYYMRSRRSRSRSSSYRRTRGAYIGKFRCRFSPSPVKSYYRRGAKSPERSVRLSQKDKMDLLNIARENAAKILGVEVVTLPASVRFVKEQVEKTRRGSDTEKRVRADPVPPQT